MITIHETVDIAADRRIHLDIEAPDTIPNGKTQVLLSFPAVEAVASKELKQGDSSRIYAGCLKGKNIFKGDPVAIQRKMRDEW